MKAVISLLVVGVLGVAGAWWYYQTQSRSAYEAARAATENARTQQQARKQADDCRDQCEQSAIVGQGTNQIDDQALRACRARCDGRAPEAKRPYEPIRSISVAPADHSRSLPPAVEAERRRLRNVKPR
jgi:type II secretory pathway pseudopilin PulG